VTAGAPRRAAARSRGTHLAVTTHTEPFVEALPEALAELGAPVTLEAG
jgi:hypothetical protein